MKNKNLIWGLFFILAGVALILDRTGLLGSVSCLLYTSPSPRD